MKFGFRRSRAIAPEVQLSKSNPDSHGHPQNCLNCGAALVGAYCHQCGQSAHTHRMSFKHFLLHDFVHGIWHLDKGFPATLKKAFVNPGKEIRAYLAGKRVGWFSILTTIVLLVAVISFLDSKLPDEPYEEDTQELLEILNHNAKWIVLSFSFIFSLSSVVCFKKSRLNLSEHTIINAFFLIGILIIYLLDIIVDLLTGIGNEYIEPLVMVLYLTYAYYNAFSKDYTFGGWVWRYLAHWVVCILLSAVLVFASIIIHMSQTGKDKIQIDTTPKLETPHAPAAH